MSNPDVKEAVIAALKGKGLVSAPTREGLQAELGLAQFSLTEFWNAVKSLYHNPGRQRLKLTKSGSRERGRRMWSVAPL